MALPTFNTRSRTHPPSVFESVTSFQSCVIVESFFCLTLLTYIHTAAQLVINVFPLMTGYKSLMDIFMISSTLKSTQLERD